MVTGSPRSLSQKCSDWSISYMVAPLKTHDQSDLRNSRYVDDNAQAATSLTLKSRCLCCHLSVHCHAVLTSCSCCNKVSQTWWLNTADICSLTVLVPRSPKSGCGLVCTSSKALRGAHPSLLQLPLAAGALVFPAVATSLPSLLFPLEVSPFCLC